MTVKTLDEIKTMPQGTPADVEAVMDALLENNRHRNETAQWEFEIIKPTDRPYTYYSARLTDANPNRIEDFTVDAGCFPTPQEVGKYARQTWGAKPAKKR